MVVSEERLAEQKRLLPADFLGRYGWLLCSIAFSVVAYLIVWRRGLYLDDYSLRVIAIDPITGGRQPLFVPASNPNYPARILTWIVLPQLASLVPDQEFLLRVLLAALVGLNAFLFGWLVYRLVPIRLVAIASGWGLLFPIFSDATLWLGAGGYLFATAFSLGFLHCTLSVLEAPRWPVAMLLFASTLLIIGLMFGEMCVSFPLFVPILWLILWVRGTTTSLVPSLVRGAIATALPLGAIVAYQRIIYANSYVIEARQGLDLSPIGLLERSGPYLHSTYTWTFKGEWGLQIVREVFSLGAGAILSSASGLLASAVATVMICLMVLFWQERREEQTVPTVAILLLMLFGLVWMVATLFVPYLFARGVVLERRYLYLPTAGLALVLVAALWLIVRHRGLLAQRLALVGVCITTGLLALLMAGHAQVYALRAEQNSDQISSLVQAIPSEVLPEGAIFVPFEIDEELLPVPSILSYVYTGIYDTPWTMNSALWAGYKRSDISAVIASRYIPDPIGYDPGNQGQILVQGTPVPVDKLVLIGYTNGQTVAVRRLTFESSGEPAVSIELPLSQAFAKTGVPLINKTITLQQ